MFLKTLSLPVYLGWPQDERLQKQTIFLDVCLRFSKPPKACLSDHLQDTVCYAHICQLIQSHVAKQKFQLIEYLAQDLYKLIKSHVKKSTRITLRLTKKPGGIKELIGGAQFCYGDEDLTWSS